MGRPLHSRDVVAADIWTVDRTIVYQLVAAVRISVMLPSYVVWQCPLASPKMKICAWDSAREERFVLGIKITTIQMFEFNRNSLVLHSALG